MLKVMLIDDEPWVLIHLERLVDWETLGFKLCGSFQSCATALEEMQKEPPDILFLDISMPETSGLDFLRKLHSTGLFPHTVVLTGFAEFEYAQDALRLGVVDYLLKRKAAPPTARRAITYTTSSSRCSLIWTNTSVKNSPSSPWPTSSA